MNREEKFILLQYVEIFCMFVSACATLIGFYFGILLIFENVTVSKGIIQCIITFVTFLILVVLTLRSIRSLKKYKKNMALHHNVRV
jgi:hypothetical protein